MTLFAKEHDYQRERAVAEKLAYAWDCELHSFGAVCPIDYYATKGGQVIALVEIKTRTHSYRKHDTVYMSCRKWMNLSHAAAGFCCPGIFVVQFTDGLFSIDVDHVHGPPQVVGHNNPRARMDREPCFLVPIKDMTPVVGRRAA
jgi:hypothetical protein